MCWARVAAVVSLVTLGYPLALHAQDIASRDAGGVTIRVVVDASGRAEVLEQVRARDDTTAQHSGFQLLARPCTAIGEVVLTSASPAAPLRRTANNPWQLFDDTSGSVGPNGDAALRYAVTLTNGGRDIPLIVPAQSLARGTDGRSPGVDISVLLPSAADRVTFPRLLRTDTPGEWRGRFVAVPSFVSVRFDGSAGACSDDSPLPSDGGLSWRFWLLVAILVVWVPTYQLWARRQPEGVR